MSERFRYEPISEPSVPPPILETDLVPLEPIELAFSRGSKRKIVERDGGRSAISGSDVNLQAAHIDHDKSNPYYDSPSNGRLLTLVEHLTDHKTRAGRNGLPENQNEWAIKKLQRKLYELYHRDGDPQ